MGLDPGVNREGVIDDPSSQSSGQLERRAARQKQFSRCFRRGPSFFIRIASRPASALVPA
jgi:hypothetical protein